MQGIHNFPNKLSGPPSQTLDMYNVNGSLSQQQHQQLAMQQQQNSKIQYVSASQSSVDAENAAFAGFRRLLAELKAKKFDQIRFAAYRTASKLRYIQKRTLFGSLDVWRVVETFRDVGLHLVDSSATINRQGMEQLLRRIYANLPMLGEQGGPAVGADGIPSTTTTGCESPVVTLPMVNQAAEILLGWLTYILDPTNCGRLAVSGLKVALSTLANGRPADKLRYHFTLLTNPAGSLQVPRLEAYMQELLSLAVGVFEEPNFSYNLQTSKFILTGRSKNIVVEEFLERMLAEPGPQTFSWLKVFHRLAIVETVRHPMKCEGCKREPIVGLRYKCTRCHRYNLCQDCFWTGITTDAHTNSHDVKEYTSSTKMHSRQFGHSLRKSFQFGKQHSTSSPSSSNSTPRGDLMDGSPQTPMPTKSHLPAPLSFAQQQQRFFQTGIHPRTGLPINMVGVRPQRMPGGYDCSLPMQMSYYTPNTGGIPIVRPLTVQMGPGDAFSQSTGYYIRPGHPPNTPLMSRQVNGPAFPPSVSGGPSTQASVYLNTSTMPRTEMSQNIQSPTVQQMVLPQGQMVRPASNQLVQNSHQQRIPQRHHSVSEGVESCLRTVKSPSGYRSSSDATDGGLTGQQDIGMNREGTLGRSSQYQLLLRQPDDLAEHDSLSKKGISRSDGDEHKIIANYAARLSALKTLTGQFENVNDVVGSTQTQKELVKQLEAKNREILLEIQRLRLEQQQQAAGIAAAMETGGDLRLGVNGNAKGGCGDPIGREDIETEDPRLVAELQVLRQRKSDLESRMNDLQGNRRDLTIQLETLMRLLKTNSGNSQSQDEVFSLSTHSTRPTAGGDTGGSGVESYYFQRHVLQAPPRRSSSLVRKNHNPTKTNSALLVQHRSFDAESLHTGGLEQMTGSLRRVHTSRVENLSTRKGAGGFERSGSQPPLNLEGNVGNSGRLRPISHSYVSQRVVPPTSGIEGEDPEFSSTAQILGRPPIHPKASASNTSSASLPSPLIGQQSFSESRGLHGFNLTSHKASTASESSTINTSTIDREKGQKFLPSYSVNMPSKMTFELGGRSSIAREPIESKTTGQNYVTDFVTVSVKGQMQQHRSSYSPTKQGVISAPSFPLSSTSGFDSGSEAYLYSDPEMAGTWGSKTTTTNAGGGGRKLGSVTPTTATCPPKVGITSSPLGPSKSPEPSS